VRARGEDDLERHKDEYPRGTTIRMQRHRER
jgi:hypothetical protein